MAAGCADALGGGGAARVVDRATTYVPDETWAALVERHRARNCDDLARLARRILNGKELPHGAPAALAGRLSRLLGRSRIEQTFARELARAIPLPWDDSLSAAARGLQIAGVYVCLVGPQNLADCASLRDVFEVEGRERVMRLVRGAAEDWRELPARLSDGSSG